MLTLPGYTLGRALRATGTHLLFHAVCDFDGPPLLQRLSGRLTPEGKGPGKGARALLKLPLLHVQPRQGA